VLKVDKCLCISSFLSTFVVLKVSINILNVYRIMKVTNELVEKLNLVSKKLDEIQSLKLELKTTLVDVLKPFGEEGCKIAEEGDNCVVYTTYKNDYSYSEDFYLEKIYTKNNEVYIKGMDETENEVIFKFEELGLEILTKITKSIIL